jgi:hypothetical protein
LQSSDVQVSLLSYQTSSFGTVFSNQRFSDCSSTMGVGPVKLSSDCFCANRVFKMNTEFCCHLCCNISMIFWTWSSLMYDEPFTYFWFSATFPPSRCLPMICVCCHNLGNCCSGYM